MYKFTIYLTQLHQEHSVVLVCVCVCVHIYSSKCSGSVFQKHASESTSSFEQRLQVMLHRMGVAKTPPADTKTSQVGRVWLFVS